ncbi:unnamed protein product [Camellia sinensis]
MIGFAASSSCCCCWLIGNAIDEGECTNEEGHTGKNAQIQTATQYLKFLDRSVMREEERDC